MASVKNCTFGMVTGKINNMVFRIQNGKLIVYPYTKSEKPLSEKTKVQNTKFILFSRFWKQINLIPLLKQEWIVSNVRGTFYRNKQFTVNYNQFGLNGDISGVNLIPSVPVFSFVIKSHTFQENFLKLTIELSSAVLFISEICYPEISAQGGMCLSGSEDSLNQPTLYIPLASGNIKFRKDSPLVFELPIIGENLEYYRTYPLKQFVINLAVKSNTSERKYFSESVSHMIS